jgi:hypothetical protein
MNQGLAYLHWLLDHKADFEKLTQNAKLPMKIDWASPRVICIAESYNKFDLAAAAAVLPRTIELYRYCLYENDLLTLEAEVQRKDTIPSPPCPTSGALPAGRPRRRQIQVLPIVSPSSSGVHQIAGGHLTNANRPP